MLKEAVEKKSRSKPHRRSAKEAVIEFAPSKKTLQPHAAEELALSVKLRKWAALAQLMGLLADYAA
jgi:hypothetical protein